MLCPNRVPTPEMVYQSAKLFLWLRYALVGLGYICIHLMVRSNSNPKLEHVYLIIWINLPNVLQVLSRVQMLSLPGTVTRSCRSSFSHQSQCTYNAPKMTGIPFIALFTSFAFPFFTTSYSIILSVSLSKTP